jgi:hypothetical protein
MKNARKVIRCAMVAMPIMSVLNVCAQTPEAPIQAVLSGIPSLDIVRLSVGGTGAPLRFGGVIKGSESVQLNGIKLVSGTDYVLDAEVGVIYIYRSFKDGESLMVSYRYDPKYKPTANAQVAGVPGMKFNLLPGQSMSMKFGMTDRTADGKVIRSNLWGTKNSFGNKGMGMSGSYFAGSRMQEQVSGGMTYAGKGGGQAEAQTGSSSFLVQAFRASLGGKGTISADIQDISSNFTGFSAVQESGYSSDQVGAFSRERGLKRQGLGISDFGSSSFSFSGNQRSVTDGDSGIRDSSYSVGMGALSMSSTSQTIERGFKRFQDLGVGNWQLLQQSQGISNSETKANYKTAFGAMSYSTNRIEDFENKNSIKRSQFVLDTKNIGFEINQQDVDQDFKRFDADRGTFGLEAGLKRQSVRLTKGIVGKETTLSFGQNRIDQQNEQFNARDVKIQGKTFSVETTSRGASNGFNRFNAMREGETDGHINQIGKMYGSNLPINAAAERGGFARSAGISREATKANFAIKGGTVNVSNTNLQGASGGVQVDNVNVTGKNLQFNLRRLNLSDTFSEVTNLMQFEQQQLGMVTGIQRTDANLNLNFGKDRSVAMEMMSAAWRGEKAESNKLAYRGKGIEVDYNQRSVSKDFSVAGGLISAESGLLAGMVGFNQTESRIKLNSLKNIEFNYQSTQSQNAFSTEERVNELLNFNWSMNPNTQVGYVSTKNAQSANSSSLFNQTMERLTLTQRLGKTAFSVVNEQQKFGGSNNTQSDSSRTTVAVETQVNKTTSLRTEQTRTAFDNGSSESISANTVSTKITGNVGVSVTDISIDRAGDEADEVKRDYGFWWDLGKGVRMTYGQNRNLNGLGGGSNATAFAFGQGVNRLNPDQAVNGVSAANVNGTSLGFANGSNAWDDQIDRTQAFSNLSIATSKPFRLGFLTNSKFILNSAMASDNSRWIREDIAGSFESSMGKYGIGMQYRGQVDQQGNRAIDRTFRLKTDASNTAALSASFAYKMRVLPTDQEFAIRDYNLNWRIGQGLQLSNQIQTNPEGPYNPNLILGTLPRADRRNAWKLDYTASKSFTFGGQFEELRNDALNSISRTIGVNMSMFGASGSPVSLFYGMRQEDGLGGRQSFVQFGFSFEQKASENQVFSLSVGNQGWLQNQNASLANRNDWTARLNYQFRFK